MQQTSELKAQYDKIDGLGVGKKAFDNVKNKNKFLRKLNKYIKNNQEKPKEEEKKWWQTEAFSIAAPLIGAAIGGVVGLGVTAYGDYKDDGELNAGAGTYIKSFIGGAIAGALVGGSAAIGAAAVTGGAVTLGTGMLGVGLAGSAGSIARQQISKGEVNYGQVAYEGTATALTFGTFTMISQYMSGAYSSSLQPSGNNYQTISKEDYDYIYGNKQSQLSSAAEQIDDNLDDIATIGVCFVAGTKILTDKGYVDIECIEKGDYVLSGNPETGEKDYKLVVTSFTKETTTIVKVKIYDELIETTLEHPFWVESEGWTGAKNLKSGDLVRLSNGTTAIIQRINIVELEYPIEVYNFEVSDWHTCYVGYNEILVHNNCNNERGVGGNGWRGDASWRGNVKTVSQSGDITSLNGQIPTKSEALALINESGGTVIRIDPPHPSGGVSTHTYPHINYVTKDGVRSAIQILP